MPTKKKVPARVVKLIDDALEAIIDDWYASVSEYYVTAEKKEADPALERPEELKRFHDENGHRIKFNKVELDFTYGLSVEATADGCHLEVSVNNKVPGFNYAELTRRLSRHYEEAGRKPVEGVKKLKNVSFGAIFALGSDNKEGITVEQREGKADIIRVPFALGEEHLEDLVAEPPVFMELIRQYCVAPLRRFYAEVYRANRRR